MPSAVPWVLVCGGFHYLGGMDRANLELATALLDQGREVSVVTHLIDPSLAAHPRLHTWIVKKPVGAILLGESALRSAAIRVARDVTTRWPKARVVANGGNCPWPDINWAHLVHAASETFDNDAPLWFRAKNRLNRRKALGDESRAYGAAKIVIANSERTRRDLISAGVSSEKIRTIYLGCGPDLKPVTPEQRVRARAQFAVPVDAPVACFVGALGYDRRKGFDTLLAAWQAADLRDAYLLVAGGGRGLSSWQSQVRQSGCAERIRLLGFTDQVKEVLAASDLLVSPARYEPFGLNVQEAIACGVPSIVSRSAGAAELYSPDLNHFLLDDPNDANQLSEMLRSWHRDTVQARLAFGCLREKLHSYSWRDMAHKFIAAAEQS
jgi:glycosyltransferase involved in cell wall biosynthesis